MEQEKPVIRTEAELKEFLEANKEQVEIVMKMSRYIVNEGWKALMMLTGKDPEEAAKESLSSVTGNYEAIYFGVVKVLAELWREEAIVGGRDSEESSANAQTLEGLWKFIDSSLRQGFAEYIASERGFPGFTKNSPSNDVN